MTIIFTILLITLILFSYAYNKYNILLFLLILSLFNDIFEFQIDVALKLHHFIVLLSLPKLIAYYFQSVILQKYLKYLLLEFAIVIVMGVIFVFIVPFDDPYANTRLFTQTPLMRGLISSVRMILEIATIILVVNWFLTKRINFNQIIRFISIVLILSVSVAVIDFFIEYQIRRMIYPEIQVISGRFFGLAGEPRYFGRYCAFGLIFLLFYSNYNSRILRKFGIAASLIGLLLSLSASSYIIAVIGVIFYLLSIRRIKSTIVFVSILISFIFILNTNSFFQSTTMSKINQVLVANENDDLFEKVSNNEPSLFTRFEIFDRAALNFFYHYPQYLIFGVGPGLISVPASPYLTITSASTYENGINSIPHSLLINTLSRSGFIGIILIGSFFFYILKRIKNKNDKYFILTFLIMSLIVATSLFYFIMGLIITFALLEKKQKIAIVLKKNHIINSKLIKKFN